MRNEKSMMVVAFFVFGLMSSLLVANPTGGAVAGGSATMSTSGSTLNVTTSDRAIINWQKFSVGTGETTKFLQPSVSSAVLNRVTGSGASSINGTLSGNGQVYVLNPNGVLVGSTGVVAVGGFVASTLDVSNAAFMSKGDLLFSGNSANSVEVRGKVNALGGDVYLIGKKIKNSGRVTASSGNAGIGAGSEVLLAASGDDRLLIQPSSAAGMIDNRGTVTAVADSLKAAGGNVYALAINNSGTVEATGSVTQQGKVFLVSDGGNVKQSGTVKAKNVDGTGGDAQLLGQTVTMPGKVDVSSQNGGGNVLIKATDTADFSGKIIGRTVNGNGANAEVSGDLSVSVTGTADLSSVNGDYGLLTLDPGTVNIIHGGIMKGPNTFSDGFLVKQLQYSNVTIRTSSATNGGPEDIFINPCVNITWCKPTKFELIAGQFIKMTNAIIENTAPNMCQDAIVMRANENGWSCGNFSGITLDNSTLKSRSGGIVLKGRGGNQGSFMNGIWLTNCSRVISTGTDCKAAKITLTGTSGNGADFNQGIFVDKNSVVTSVSGDICMIGKGIGYSSSNTGVCLDDGGIVSSTGTDSQCSKAATITVVGTGGNGSGGSNFGVAIGLAVSPEGVFHPHQQTSFITSKDGDIFITGVCDPHSTGVCNIGVVFYRGIVSSTGCGPCAAKICIQGTSGGGNHSESGVEANTCSYIISKDGDICVRGWTIPCSTGFGNVGVLFLLNAGIMSTGVGCNAADICVQGFGGGGDWASGVALDIWGTEPNQSQFITAVDGNVSVLGVKGPASSWPGVSIRQNSFINTTGTGILKITSL